MFDETFIVLDEDMSNYVKNLAAKTGSFAKHKAYELKNHNFKQDINSTKETLDTIKQRGIKNQARATGHSIKQKIKGAHYNRTHLNKSNSYLND